MAEITRKDLFDTLNEFYGKVLEPRLIELRSDLMSMIKNLRISFNILINFIKGTAEGWDGLSHRVIGITQ